MEGVRRLGRRNFLVSSLVLIAGIVLRVDADVVSHSEQIHAILLQPAHHHPWHDADVEYDRGDVCRGDF